MALLFITEQGATIHQHGHRIVVERKGEVLYDIPLHHLDALLLFGGIHLTTPAATCLMDAHIPTTFLTQGGTINARLLPASSGAIDLRLAQYHQNQNTPFRINIARTVIASKVNHASQLIAQADANRPNPDLKAANRHLQGMREKIVKCEDLDSLRGLEGAGARATFEAYRIMFRGMAFEGRKRRPPPDPVNALLSFGYTLVGNELHAILESAGFDPFLGVFHETQNNRPSLALDLLEEFRVPIVDRLVLRLVNRKELQIKHFTHEENTGVRLTKEGLRTFLEAYHKMLGEQRDDLGERTPSFRALFRKQTEQLMRTYRCNEPFRSAFERSEEEMNKKNENNEKREQCEDF